MISHEITHQTLFHEASPVFHLHKDRQITSLLMAEMGYLIFANGLGENSFSTPHRHWLILNVPLLNMFLSGCESRPNILPHASTAIGKIEAI